MGSFLSRGSTQLSCSTAAATEAWARLSDEVTQKDGALTALCLGLLLNSYYYYSVVLSTATQMRGSHWDSTQGTFQGSHG